jgi:hypothetical protein
MKEDPAPAREAGGLIGVFTIPAGSWCDSWRRQNNRGLFIAREFRMQHFFASKGYQGNDDEAGTISYGFCMGVWDFPLF